LEIDFLFFFSAWNLNTFANCYENKRGMGEANGEGFDRYGTLLYMKGMIAFIYGLSSITSSPWAKYSFGVGIGVLALFIRQELKSQQPIINIRFFRGNPAFVFGNLAALIYFVTTSSVAFLLSLHLQTVAGYNS